MLDLKQIQQTDCPVCEGKNFILKHYLRDHEYQTIEQDFPVNKCSSCGVFFLSPRPNELAFNIIYPDSYANYRTNETKTSYVRKISNSIQTRRVRRILERFGLRDDFNVLDVGCGDGYMLDRIKEAYPSTRTFGIEPNSTAAGIAAKSHNIFNGLLEEYPLDENRFDLIISSHVIEHVSNPVSFLKLLQFRLAQGGIMVIDTPNIDSFQYKLFGRHWGGFHAPRHWTLFTPDSLELAARRAGLKKQEIIQVPINVFWIWSLHSIFFSKVRMRKFASKFFNTKACVESPSIYYLSLLIIFEVFDRISKPFGAAQMRAIFVSSKDSKNKTDSREPSLPLPARPSYRDSRRRS